MWSLAPFLLRKFNLYFLKSSNTTSKNHLFQGDAFSGILHNLKQMAETLQRISQIITCYIRQQKRYEILPLQKLSWLLESVLERQSRVSLCVSHPSDSSFLWKVQWEFLFWWGFLFGWLFHYRDFKLFLSKNSPASLSFPLTPIHCLPLTNCLSKHNKVFCLLTPNWISDENIKAFFY